MPKIKIDENDQNTFVICPICNMKLSKIVHWHIKSHGLTVKEFEEKYNTTSTQRSCIALRKSTACTLENMVMRYGDEEGNKRWKEYCNKQSVKNTFLFKQQKYGWSKEEFDVYNKARASTKSNFIKRYGEEEGKKKWEEYRELQSYAGSSELWFINKLGEKEGKKKWKEICFKKQITKELFVRKYGELESVKRWNEFILNKSKGFSKISQELFYELDKKFDSNAFCFANKNSEYIFSGTSIIRVDFYCPLTNKVIEFFGDYWHMNPSIYTESDINTMINQSASDIWCRDSNRINELKTIFGVNIKIVWEQDYRKDKERIIQDCINFLNE
jgi:hypothetical protein